MKNTNENKTKNTTNKKNKNIFSNQNVWWIIGGCALAIIVLIVIYVAILGSTKVPTKLDEFQKVAIYGYLEDYLSLDKLYLKAGKSNYDDLQYTQSKVKQILDSEYQRNPESTISTSVISAELSNLYDISSDTIDYHGILVSDYEFVPEEDAFKRVDGANRAMASIENVVELTGNSNEKISITGIEKLTENSYKVNFNVVDSLSVDRILNSGNATIIAQNGAYELDSCSFDN